MPRQLTAEVIAFGDEITSGQRLDTNSQWISQMLGEQGIRVAFHSTVGDDLADSINVLTTATARVDVVVSTGGIGPTADDLTRQVIATVAGVELELRAEVIQHIRGIFAQYNREMPESNAVQALFPRGSLIIDNPEGTAPGIEIQIPTNSGRGCTVFALPGVPYEMKQMWPHVENAIGQLTGQAGTTHHHVIHCFGAGESQIELMLPDLVNRDRVPRVGITASKATISLRISVRAETKEKCIQQIQPTIQTIHDCLGELVFGENGSELQQVVNELLTRYNKNISIVDFGFGGAASQLISQVDRRGKRLVGSTAVAAGQLVTWSQAGPDAGQDPLQHAATRIRRDFNSDIGVAIGPTQKMPNSDAPARIFEIVIASDSGAKSYRLDYGGHSGLRAVRTTKQILNTIRLHLLGQYGDQSKPNPT